MRHKRRSLSIQLPSMSISHHPASQLSIRRQDTGVSRASKRNCGDVRRAPQRRMFRNVPTIITALLWSGACSFGTCTHTLVRQASHPPVTVLPVSTTSQHPSAAGVSDAFHSADVSTAETAAAPAAEAAAAPAAEAAAATAAEAAAVAAT